MAQLVEQRIRNAWVECSSHSNGRTKESVSKDTGSFCNCYCSQPFRLRT